MKGLYKSVGRVWGKCKRACGMWSSPYSLDVWGDKGSCLSPQGPAGVEAFSEDTALQGSPAGGSQTLPALSSTLPSPARVPIG